MKISYVIALVIAAATALWVLSGQVELTAATAPEAPAGQAEADAPGEAAVPTVRVARLQAEPMVNDVVLSGHTSAARRVEIRAETSGRVAEVAVARGQPVEAGTVVVRLATENREANLAQARALLAQRRLEYDAASQLGQRGFQSDVRVAEAKAQLEAAQAELARTELELTRTAIRAPFDGVLDERPVELGDYLNDGDVVGTVVDLDPIRIVGFVTERDVALVERGGVGQARMIDGTEAEGRITYVSATADPATRTFRIELELANPGNRIPEGLTAQLRIPVAQRMAHQVSPAVLTLADDGTIGVKLVDGDDVVRFQPVRILKDTPTGMWLAGLPEEATLITVGQEFVVPGQKVRPVAATASEAR